MSLDAIAAIGAIPTVEASQHTQQSAPGSQLFHWIEQQLGDVDETITMADQSVRQLIVGDAQDLHRVMMDIERARLSLDLVVQVRNRVVEAYQEVLKMQI